MPQEFGPRYHDEPREGYFKLRAWRRGPWKPARIYRPVPYEPGTLHICDRWPPLVAEIDGEIVDDIFEVWHWGREITEEEWIWLANEEWPKRKAEARE